MNITFDSENIDFPDIDKKEISSWIKMITVNYNKDVGDIAYIFCDDEKILEINNQYLKHDYYTDIISFDYTEGDLISGDIFISLDTVLTNSQMYNTNYPEELHRVIIHGILHLCGFNDNSEEEIKKMREAEEHALKLLKSTSNLHL